MTINELLNNQTVQIVAVALINLIVILAIMANWDEVGEWLLAVLKILVSPLKARAKQKERERQHDEEMLRLTLLIEQERNQKLEAQRAPLKDDRPFHSVDDVVERDYDSEMPESTRKKRKKYQEGYAAHQQYESEQEMH